MRHYFALKVDIGDGCGGNVFKGCTPTFPGPSASRKPGLRKQFTSSNSSQCGRCLLRDLAERRRSWTSSRSSTVPWPRSKCRPGRCDEPSGLRADHITNNVDRPLRATWRTTTCFSAWASIPNWITSAFAAAFLVSTVVFDMVARMVDLIIDILADRLSTRQA